MSLLLIWCLLNSIIFASHSNDLEMYELQSTHFLRQNDWRKSFHSLFSALHEAKKDSQDEVRLNIKLAHLYFHFKKSLGDAEGFYKQALQIDPYAKGAYLGLGDVYFARKQYRQAIHYYEMAIKYHQDSYLAYSSVAMAFYELGETERATHLYKKALQKNPKDIVSLNNLGNIALDALDLNLSADYYEQALKINSDFQTAHANLANVYLYQKKYQLAKEEFSKALELHYEDPAVHSNLANLYYEKRLLERAKFHLRKALYYEDHPIYHNNLAVMEKFTREYKTAGIEYAKTLKRNSKYSNARRNSGFFKNRSMRIRESLNKNQKPFQAKRFVRGEWRQRKGRFLE
ncbi:tetratricopeptide repeat protein [bacterium]|nr:tetratricopeptide repeat protein [bacterium]